MKKILSLLVCKILLLGFGTLLFGQAFSTPDTTDHVFIRDLPGPTAVATDRVSFHISMRGKTSAGDYLPIWSTTENNRGKPVDYTLPHADSVSLIEILALHRMSVGDSLHCWQSNDPNTFKSLEECVEIHYSIGVVEILSDSLYRLKIATERAANEARAEVIRQEMESIFSDYQSGALDDRLIDLEGGMKKLRLSEGTGPKPEAGQEVVTHYYGLGADGRYVDDSFSRGEQFSSPLGKGRVITGWELGVAGMHVGERAVFFIPAEMAYGKGGSPPRVAPNEDLIYLIDLIDLR